MTALLLTPKSRPAHALAWLARHDLGEIVVRQGGRTLERRQFPVARGGQDVPMPCACADCEQARVLSEAVRYRRCPLCRMFGCPGTQAACMGRWAL